VLEPKGILEPITKLVVIFIFSITKLVVTFIFTHAFRSKHFNKELRINL
jgi:hypothetical protein